MGCGMVSAWQGPGRDQAERHPLVRKRVGRAHGREALSTDRPRGVSPSPPGFSLKASLVFQVLQPQPPVGFSPLLVLFTHSFIHSVFVTQEILYVC